MHLYRRSDDRKRPGPWYVEKEIDGKRFRRSTRIHDKPLAERKARAMCDRWQLEMSGLEAPPEAPKTCGELVELYRANQERAGVDPYNLGQTLRWLRKILPLGRLAVQVDGHALMVEVCRTKAASSRRRLYEYVRALFNWAVAAKLVARHPFAGLAGPKKVRVWKKRRAFALTEFVALIRRAPFGRAVVYVTGARTGLRNGELRELERRDLCTHEWKLTVRREITKTDTDAILPIPGDLREWLEELLELRGALKPHDRLFARVERRAEVLYRDLEAAGVARVNGDGRLDFHALRTSFVTWLGRVAPQAQVQQLGRLETASLFALTYSRYGLEEDRAALERAVPGGLLGRKSHGTRVSDPMEEANCQGATSAGSMLVGDTGFEPFVKDCTE